MKRETTDIIILHTTKFGENSIVVHALSPVYGRCGLIIKGVGGTRKNKRVSALFQPLNILEAVVDENPRSALLSLRDVQMKHCFPSIRGNILKNCISVFISEVLYRILSDGSREEGLFEWVEKMACTLEELNGNFSNFHLYFIIGLCRVLGFAPGDDTGYVFSEENSALLHKLAASGFVEAMALPATGNMRLSFMEDMIGYLEYHTDKTIDAKSLKILHEILC